MSIELAMARVAELSSLVAPAQAGPPVSSAPPPSGPSFAELLRGANAAASAAAPVPNAAPGTIPLAPGAAAAPGAYTHLSGDLDASPQLLARLDALAATRGERWEVTSGLRTLAEQQQLWDRRTSNPFPVARPGNSLHESGSAADVTVGGRPIQHVVSAAELRAAGLAPLSGDAVHVELASG